MKLPRVDKWCQQCGAHFQVKPSKKDKAKFCSVPCRRLSLRKDIKHVDCDACGKNFRPSSQHAATARFCSRKCHFAYIKVPEKDLTCERCAVVFTSKMDHGKWPRYCSRKCFEDSPTKPIKVSCPVCEKVMTAKHKNGQHQKYCSRPCTTKAKTERVMAECSNCGELHERSKGRARPRVTGFLFCSHKCQGELLRGALGGNYKGGRYVAATGFAFVKTESCWRGEHRLVAEKCLGRALHWDDEPILHINAIKDDNRPENLYVCMNRSELMHIVHSYDAPYPVTSNLPTIPVT